MGKYYYVTPGGNFKASRYNPLKTRSRGIASAISAVVIAIVYLIIAVASPATAFKPA